MKGLELPINVLIIIVLAVIVLIAVVAFFYPSFFSGSQTVGVESAKTQACRSLIAIRCTDSSLVGVINFDANQDGNIWNISSQALANGDTLLELCTNYFQTAVDEECRAMCGC